MLHLVSLLVIAIRVKIVIEASVSKYIQRFIVVKKRDVLLVRFVMIVPTRQVIVQVNSVPSLVIVQNKDNPV